MGFLTTLTQSLENIGLQVRTPAEHPVWFSVLRERAEDRATFEFRSAARLHATVYACVRLIASRASAVPLKVFHNGQLVQDKFPVTDVIQYPSRIPGEEIHLQQWLEHIIWGLLLTGNEFTQVIRDKRAKIPVQLWPITADEATPILGGDTRLVGYEFSIRHETFFLPRQDVIHFKLINPENPYLGLSPLSAVRKGIITDMSAIEFNRQFFEHQAIPSAVLSTDQWLHQAEADKYVQDWVAKYRGKHGVVAVLGKGLRFQPITMPQKDAQFIEQRKLTSEDIKMVLGVPSPLIGSTGQVAYSAYYVFWDMFRQCTIFPLLSYIQSILNQQLMPQFGKAYHVEFDLDKVQEPMQGMEARIRAMRDGIQAAIPPRILYEKLFTEPAPYKHGEGDTAYVPANVVPMGYVNQAVLGPEAKPISQSDDNSNDSSQQPEGE